MRIAIFTDTYLPYTSGVTTHIRILKEGLEKKGHQVLIVTVDPTVPNYIFRDNVLYCPGIAIKKIYGYGVTNPLSFHRLDIIRKFNPDIIHIQTEFAIGMFGLWASRRLKKPVIYTLHTMYDDYTNYVFPHYAERVGKSVSHRYFHIIAAHANEIIVPSKKAITFLERCKVKRQVNFIPNIAEPVTENKEKTKEIKEKYHLNDAEAVLCFAGRLGKEKSVDVLLSLTKELLKNHPSIKLFVVGGGPEEQNLKDLAKKLNIENNVVFTGMVPHEEVIPYFHASDLYVTASTSEMNSISALEAMNGGLMVLQRLDESNRYQIIIGRNGWTFETPEEFCNLVDDYLKQSPEEKLEMRNMVISYSEKYGMEEFFSKVLEVYHSVTDAD